MDTAAREREIEEKLAKRQDKEKEEKEMVRYSCLDLRLHGNRIPHWVSWLPVVARHHAILSHSKLLLLSIHQRQQH